MKFTKEQALTALRKELESIKDCAMWQGEDDGADDYRAEISGTIDEIESGRKTPEEACGYISFNPLKNSCPRFTKEQKEFLRDFINNKLVPVQFLVDELIEKIEEMPIKSQLLFLSDKNIKLISKFLKNLEEGKPEWLTKLECPHCGTTEMLCGYNGPGCKKESIKITQETLKELEMDNCGICKECKVVKYGVEPDAENYECESCGEDAVEGIGNLMIAGDIIITDDEDEQNIDW